MRLLPFVIVALITAGCAAPRHYDWGGYDELLYQAYKDPSKMEVMKIKLETHIGSLEQHNQKVAPGLYAELGTLYYQGGNNAKAVSMYERERSVWPESKGLMDSLISNINRRTQSSTQSETKR